jgi:hypothetical protein
MRSWPIVLLAFLVSGCVSEVPGREASVVEPLHAGDRVHVRIFSLGSSLSFSTGQPVPGQAKADGSFRFEFLGCSIISGPDADPCMSKTLDGTCLVEADLNLTCAADVTFVASGSCSVGSCRILGRGEQGAVGKEVGCTTPGGAGSSGCAGGATIPFPMRLVSRWHDEDGYQDADRFGGATDAKLSLAAIAETGGRELWRATWDGTGDVSIGVGIVKKP